MYLYILFIFLLMRFIMWALSNVKSGSFRLNFLNGKVRNINRLFENNFIDPKVLFATKFRALANISLIKYINTSEAYAMIAKNFTNEITAVYQYTTFDHDEKKTFFNMTIFVLKNKRMVVLGYDYAEVLYTRKDYNWMNVLLNDLANFRENFRVTNRTKVMGFANSEVMN